MADTRMIRARYDALSDHLDKRGRRTFAATEAKTAGCCGIAAVARATGIAASTIGRGLKELAATDVLDLGRVRRAGGGGKKRVSQDPTLLADLLALVEPDARGDPMSPLRWTCKSLSHLTRALVAGGHRVGRTLVGALLRQQKFSLQANRKTREGDSHPDRDAQFSHLNESVRAALALGEPVISVDTVIHYDPWWNPAAEDQASDRAHRIGQTKSVFIYKLIAANTVEDRILELQRSKARLASIALGGEGDLGGLEVEDMEFLFGDAERLAA